MALSKQISLQEQIDNTKEGGTLYLIPGEYAGPVVINKEIMISGKNITIWALEGPVVTINSNVYIDGVSIEVTGDYINGENQHGESAIVLTGPFDVVFSEVSVRGNIVGVMSESGIWRYPRVINLGSIKSRCRHKFILKIVVPMSCKLDCSGIAGLSANSYDLNEGVNEIELALDAAVPNAIVYGNLCLKTDLFRRYITISASVSDKGILIEGYTAWQPDELCNSEKTVDTLNVGDPISVPSDFATGQANDIGQFIADPLQPVNPTKTVDDPISNDSLTVYSDADKTVPLQYIPVIPPAASAQSISTASLQLKRLPVKPSSMWEKNNGSSSGDTTAPSLNNAPTKSSSKRIINVAPALPAFDVMPAQQASPFCGDAEDTIKSNIIKSNVVKQQPPAQVDKSSVGITKTSVTKNAKQKIAVNNKVPTIFDPDGTNQAGLTQKQSSISGHLKKTSKRIVDNGLADNNFWVGE